MRRLAELLFVVLNLVLLQLGLGHATIHWYQKQDTYTEPDAIVNVGDFSSHTACTQVLYKTLIRKIRRQIKTRRGLSDGELEVVLESGTVITDVMGVRRFIRFNCCALNYIIYDFQHRCSPMYRIICPPNYEIEIKPGLEKVYRPRPNLHARCITSGELAGRSTRVRADAKPGTSTCLNANAPAYVPQSTMMQGLYIPRSNGEFVHIPILFVKLYQKHSQHVPEKLIKQGQELAASPLFLQLPKVEYLSQKEVPQYSLCLETPPEVDVAFSALIAPAA